MKQYSDVFAWSYDDLKVYDTSVIRHTIPWKENEIRKLFDAKIIICLRHSKWLANIVPVRKKNGEIILCIDFINLNRVSLKDNYPLPKMDHILWKFVASHRISTLDVFSGYNQILVHPDDQEKNCFHHSLGNFHVREDALWAYECWSYFLACNGHYILKREGQVCCDLFGWYHFVF